jgi:signal transduction histidine kinase
LIDSRSAMMLISDAIRTGSFGMHGRRHLLIIDDEKRLADSVKALFEAVGYAADVAYSGTDGLAKIRDGEYQVIITDIRMPDLDGYEIMRFVKETRPHSLVIAITGYVSTESAIKAIRQAAFDYIPKPYDFDQLRDVVDRAFTQIETRQMREDLISMITHDIKVPLNSIMGYSHMALEGKGGGLHERAREFLELISINSQRILSLVDNFLTTCRVEAGRLEILPMAVDVADVLEDLRPVTELEARKRGVELRVLITCGDPTVLGDDNLLFRAFGNLCQNAIKYAGEGGKVEVWLHDDDRPDGDGTRRWVAFEIANTGQGIPADVLPCVFDRYVRLKSGLAQEGAGLGLYVVRIIVEAHNGLIEAESQPNERTVFRVLLPPAAGSETKSVS